MKPVFNQLYKNMMEASLYMHNLIKLNNNLELLSNALKNATKKTVITNSHVVTDSDSLRNLAIKYYGDVSLWRKIAIFNNIDSTSIVTGTVIELPDKQVLNGL